MHNKAANELDSAGDKVAADLWFWNGWEGEKEVYGLQVVGCLENKLIELNRICIANTIQYLLFINLFIYKFIEYSYITFY